MSNKQNVATLGPPLNKHDWLKEKYNLERIY